MASFCNFFYSFQQIPIHLKYVVQCFELFPEFYIATFCNFFDFCVQLFTAVFIKHCTKCKSVIKKILQLFQFSYILFVCMKKSYITH